MKIVNALQLLSLLLPASAFADHSLQDVTEWAPEVLSAINKLQSENQVTCDLANSEQKEGGTASQWTQTARCTPSGTITITYDIAPGAKEEEAETITLVSSQFQK